MKRSAAQNAVLKKSMISACFGGAVLGLAGCTTLDVVGGSTSFLPPRPVGNVPENLTPQFIAPTLPPVIGDYNTPHSTLPAGISRASYYGSEAAGTILVDIANHRLYHVQGGGSATVYPIGSPRDGATIPPADNIVTRKAVNPTWTPTANMRRRNPNLPAQVAGGVPQNPLGLRALYLGDTLYRIHGTNEPQSIGSAASSGCIRMLNEHVIHLYDSVAVGTAVRVYRHGMVPGINVRQDTRPAYHLGTGLY